MCLYNIDSLVGKGGSSLKKELITVVADTYATAARCSVIVIFYINAIFFVSLVFLVVYSLPWLTKFTWTLALVLVFFLVIFVDLR